MNTDVDPNTNYLVIEFDGQRGWSVIGKGTGREITERSQSMTQLSPETHTTSECWN